MEKRDCQRLAMAKKPFGKIKPKFAGKRLQRPLNIGKQSAKRKRNVKIGAPGAVTLPPHALPEEKKKGSDFAGRTKIVF